MGVRDREGSRKKKQLWGPLWKGGEMRYPSLVLVDVLLVIVLANVKSHELHSVTSAYTFMPCFSNKRFTKLNLKKPLLSKAKL